MTSACCCALLGLRLADGFCRYHGNTMDVRQPGKNSGIKSETLAGLSWSVAQEKYIRLVSSLRHERGWCLSTSNELDVL